jgi:uncharacterized membrane protein YcfT|eukprot:SAG25_NODE_4493_length_803_cov_1.167614_1_plen_167_part_00
MLVSGYDGVVARCRPGYFQLCYECPKPHAQEQASSTKSADKDAIDAKFVLWEALGMGARFRIVLLVLCIDFVFAWLRRSSLARWATNWRDYATHISNTFASTFITWNVRGATAIYACTMCLLRVSFGSWYHGSCSGLAARGVGTVTTNSAAAAALMAPPFFFRGSA